MGKLSAGVIVYRRTSEGADVFLVHPGGPFWAKKDDGAWSIPKGLYDETEDALTAAQREFTEETGFELGGTFEPLGQFKQPSGKTILAFAVEGDLDAGALKSNLFEMEWPPRSGRTQEFPEVDRGGWFDVESAQTKITKGQLTILIELAHRLGLSMTEQKALSPKGAQGSLFS